MKPLFKDLYFLDMFNAVQLFMSLNAFIAVSKASCTLLLSLKRTCALKCFFAGSAQRTGSTGDPPAATSQICGVCAYCCTSHWLPIVSGEMDLIPGRCALGGSGSAGGCFAMGPAVVHTCSTDVLMAWLGEG